MSGIACAKCAKFYRVKKMGVSYEEGMPKGETWGPYKLWLADLCECPGCGSQILLTATGQRPIAEHFHKDYATVRENLNPMVRVDDCGGKKP